MGAWELLLVGVVIVLGLCGVLVPGVPGSWLVWAAVLWWALTDPRALTWGVLVGATVVLLLDRAIRWGLPPRRLRQSGATPERACTPESARCSVSCCCRWSVRFRGCLAGIYLYERPRLGGHGPAKAAVRTVMRSGGWSVLTELFACLLIAGAWLAAVIWG